MESPEVFSGLNVSKQMAGFSDGGGHLALDMVHEATEEKIVTETGEPQSAMVAQELSSGNRSCVMCSAHLKNKTTCGEQGLQSEADWLPEGQCKKGQKSQKPGKYVCHYCGRACAKPSVLKKHIRSHTGERPYPCIPCGFSFKTKSNLYKHRKSHTHAVKAGLVSLSKQDSKDISMDEDFQSGDGEAHTDAEQSSDSDEEDVEDVSLDSSSPTCPLDRGGTGQETGGSLLQEEPVTLLNTMSSGSDLSASGKISLWQFREKMRAPVHQVDQSMESCTIKQRLALRLTEKRNQDSDHSLSLPSSYSKGSTDSGYFSRSESAEQQANQPSVSVKSYQEIMFGKCYRPISKPKQSITVQTCVTDTNDSTSSFMVKLKKRNVSRQTMPHLLRSIKADTESLQEEDYQESDIFSPFQSTSVDLDVPSDVGSFTRSNSLPAAESDTGSPQGLRNSSSFDERMINDRGSGGMRRLRRQTAFEHSAHEGHPDSDNHSTPACSVQKPEMKCFKMSENVNIGMENNPEIEPLMHQSHVMETVTRKRRKDKGEVKEDELSKQKSIDISGLSRDFYSNQLNPTSFEQKETTHHLPDCYNLMSASLKDMDNRLGMNAISVIQHTNSVGRLHFGEKSQKWDVFYLSDTENYKNAKTVEPLFPSSEGNSRLISERLNVSHHQICQSIIQVPEIRVTEEPDGAEKVAETQGKLREKAVECFQWPQRSETLAQFPVEKLPPKKKRLRLAEMEHSSGESSFESACTSFSKSPSQDSNTSHFSSFSMSLEREEITTPCPTKQDEFAKHIELLAVPGGGHTLSLPSPNHNKEMRRSSSELAPCTLPVEVPEFRSKSFDYGNLSPSSRQGEVCSSSFIKARRRGHLVRQASLSFDPEIVLHEKCMDMSVVEKGSGHVHECLCPATCPVCPSPVLKEEVFARVQHVRDILAVHQEAGEICSASSTDKPATEEMSSSEKKNWPLSCGRILEQMPDWHPQLDPQEIQNLPCTQLQHLKNEQGDSRTVTSHVGFRDSLEDCLQHLINVQALPDHQIVYNHCAQPLHTGSSVPVRIQMDIPCYGKMTYTSMSRLDSQTQSINRSKSVNEITTPSSFVCPPSQLISGHPRGLLCNSQLSPAKLNTGIPLSLTSKTISTTEAPSGGASKRMLSPASSIEVFIEATQQKRLKEEKMYGQIVEELSAVELGAPIFAKEIKEEAKSKTHPQTEELSLVSGQSTPKASKAILSSITPHFKVVRPSDSLTTPPQTITDSMDEASEPTQETGDDGPNGVSPQVLMANKQHISGELTASCSRAFGASILLNQIVGAQLFSQFPSLHTTTCVSWCYLSSTRPNSSQTRPLFSVYSASFVRGHNPNPLSLSTRTALALLRVKQSRHDSTYTIASMCPPEILATSTTWKETQEQDMLDCKEKDIKHGTRIRDIFRRSKLVKEESKESEASQDQTGPARIKIFEGGFKSNEEYVYVRGRGRGKYICEECGIRCKKPSMLKKHIRTHTDVRPYICKCCNFAFKTKGNLTKHMKSKAHMKKCLELGVSPVTIDSTEDADIESGIQRESLHTSTEDSRIKHQFSVLDDSDGGEEDGDELDDEEDEEYDDDSTPTSVSRSTSPQPCLSSIVSLSSLQKPSSREECGITQPVGTDNSPQHNPSKLRKDETITMLSPEQASIFNPWSSHTLSPFWESTTQRYLWPADDLSPQGHLSPRRDISPLRAVSPRRELSLRGDLSPLRHPSPGGVVSPGVEVSRQRVFSPRARHRGVPRAGSPRRVSSQHRPLLDQGRSTGPLRQSNRGDAGTELDERESILQNLSFPVDLSRSKEPSTPAHRDIFSHLPLHSQQQTHTAVPMIPIGGIRMPSLPSAGNPVPSNTEAPPPGTLPKTSSLSQAPADVLGLVDQHQLEVKPSTCMRSSQQRTSAPANQGNKQEENVQICAEAIASLKITSEDFAKATGFQVHFT